MSLEILARQSLKQFSTILAEVRQERGDVHGDELEALMWEKITGGLSDPSPQYKTSANLIPSTLLKKLKVQLPYLPSIINYLGCPGLKACGGLYVPCGAKCVGGVGSLCLICTKHDAKFGRLADRGMPGTYMGGPKPEISYGTWLARQTKKEKNASGEEIESDMTIDDVYAELRAEGFTFTIPEEQLKVNTRIAVPKRRPGRPGVVKKTIVNEDGTESPTGSSLDGFDHKVILGSESDTSALTDDEKPKKKKASPKKKKTEEDEEAVTAMVATNELAEKVKERKAKAPKEEKEAKAPKEPKAKAEKEAKAPKEEKESKAKAEKEPKAPKAEKEAKAPKAEKAPKPKPRPLKVESPKVEAKKEEDEYEDEEIEFEGVKYMLRGDVVYGIDDGKIKGRLSEDGDVELA
jgi:hypothetical protein